jgi:hypothetical protein
MWGGVLEPALEEATEVAGDDTAFEWQAPGVYQQPGALAVAMAAKKKPVDNPKDDPEDDPGDDDLAADEELEEVDADDLEGGGDAEGDDYPEVDDDLIDLDDEWDDQDEDEKHDNPHKFYE